MEIVKQCCQKKFNGNVRRMARWLGTADQNLHQWLRGTTIPAWVLLRIRDSGEDFLVKEAAEEYKALRLDKNLLRPFLPMLVLIWVSNELLRMDRQLSVRLIEVLSERCAFDDDQVWEIKP